MQKRVSYAFGKKVYLLGRGKDGCHYWLEEPSWDCDWYWGFGFVETYTLDTRPSLSHDIASHQHFDYLFLRGPKDCHSMFTEFFEETPLTDGEIWQLLELMQTFYTLKKAAATFVRGGSHITENQFKNIIQSEHRAKELNAVVIPPIAYGACKLLTPDQPKTEKEGR